MQWVAFALAKLALAVVRVLPLGFIAAVGRAGGRLAFVFDRRHRRVALKNIAIAFPEKSAAKRHAIARENFTRVGQNFALAVKVALLPREHIGQLLEVTGLDHVRAAREQGRGVITLMGHFGNWELLSRIGNVAPEIKALDVYRRMKFPALDKLVHELRSAGGMHFVERGEAAAAAVAWLRQNEMVSLFIDQRAGAGRGLWLSFFGRLTSCEIGPAVLARRTGAALMPVYCEPVGPLRWRLHLLPPIPTVQRTTEEIVADIFKAQEELVRRDPANWFWAHDRWKSPRQFLTVNLPKNNVAPQATQPFRILLRSVNWLGDAVMTMPAVQRIKESRPDAHITMLTEPKLADLWRLHPDVDEVLVQPRTNNPLTTLRYARELKQHRFDAAIIFPNSWRSALAIWLARIPRRVGFRGHRRAWMLTDCFEESADYQTSAVMAEPEIRQWFAAGAAAQPPRRVFKHQLHRHLELVARLGGAASPCAPRLRVDAAGDDMPLPTDKPLLALNAGAEYGPAKRWPVDRFIAAAKTLAERDGVRWLIIGGPKEKPLAEQIATALGNEHAINLTGQTTLRGLCKLLARCKLLLTNDSGPMHIAAAVGTPVVAIFGSTEPSLTGPGMPGESRHIVLRYQPPCSPCFLRECPIDFRCMNAVTVEEVVTAVRKVFSVQ